MFCKPPHPPMHPVYIVIFRGDDTDFVGNQEILVKIHTERDISGCKAYFKYMGNVQTFDEIPEDKELHLVFSREQTKEMPLGTWDAELYLIDEQGRRMTVNNRIHMLVTNSVREAYFPDDPQAVTVVINANEYLKDAEVSQDGKTLTLTKRDGTTVSFRGGGGGGGTDDYNDLENKPTLNDKTLQGDVVLTGSDIMKDDSGLEETVADAIVGLGTDLGMHVLDTENPHAVTAGQVGAYTTDQVDGLLANKANSSDVYDKEDIDLKLSAKQDELTDDQKSVLDGGPYLGATGSQRIESDGAGASLTIEGDSSNGGVIYVMGGGYNGAFLSVENGVSTPASIKKGGKEVATEEQVESAKTELNARIDLIEATSRPNMNIVGSPTFREGNVSGFSANDYLVFPTAVSVGQNTVEFHMAFHTGSDVNTQQNIMDSWCGLAFAIRNGTTVTAISTNGTSFLAESVGGTIRANNSYRLKMLFSYEDEQYRTRIYLADGAGDFVEVGTGFTADAPLYATATYWGGANPGHATHVFRGIINLNECRMLFNGVEVWRGYDELPTVKFDPTATPRLDTAEKIVGVIEDAVSLNNRFLVGGSYSTAPAEGSPTTAAIQTRTDETAEWTDEIRVDKGYDAVQGSTMVKLDKSVQKITVASSSLSIVLPEETQGTVRDLCIYVNNNSGADCALVFPAGTYYGDNPNGAVAKDGGVTAVYITEMPVDSWMLRIVELEQFTVEATT